MSTVLYEANGIKVTQCGDGRGRTRLEVIAADPSTIVVVHAFALANVLLRWAAQESNNREREAWRDTLHEWWY